MGLLRRSDVAFRAPAVPEPDPAVVASAAAEPPGPDPDGYARTIHARPTSAAGRAASRRHDAIGQLSHVRSTRVAAITTALTAAAQVMDGTDNAIAAPNALTRTWQHAAFGYVYTVPELNAAAMYVGNALSRCELTVGLRKPDGTVVGGMEDGKAVKGLDQKLAEEAAELIASLRAPIGGQSELLRSYGEKMFISGECYMVPGDGPDGLTFRCLSTLELLREGNEWVEYAGPGYKNTPLPAGVIPIRIWRPEARYHKMASSSVRSCLEVLEELVILTRLVRSSAISRMALAGVLLIPDELDYPDDEEGADGQESTNPLVTDMINTGAKAIDDPASAASWMPFVLQGPMDTLAHVRHVAFEADSPNQVVHRREALERLAQGLDLPVEVIMGFEKTTYANAFQVSEDRFIMHLQPALQQLCEGMTAAYLWPALAKMRGLDAGHLEDAPYPDDLLTVAVTFNATKLISRPNRVEEFIKAWHADESQTALRRSELREVLGLDPDQFPDDDEIKLRVDALRLVKIRETIQLPPTTSDSAVPIGMTDGAVMPGQSEGEAQLEARAAARGVGQQAVAEGPTEPPDAGAAALSLQIAGAVDGALERVVERVGAKLRTAVKGPSAEVMREAANSRLAWMLGPDAVVQHVGRDVDALIETEAGALARTVARWAAATSVPPAAAAEAAVGLLRAVVADQLCEERLSGVQPAKVAGLLSAAV